MPYYTGDGLDSDCLSGEHKSQADCWGVKMSPGHGGRKNVGLDPLPSLRTNHHPHQPLYNKASIHGLAFLLDCLRPENGTDKLSQKSATTNKR